MSKLSIIIPSYNSAATIGITLAALQKQNTDLIKEILLVDSSDDSLTREAIKAASFDLVQCVFLENKTPPGETRNIGAKQAKGDILVFLDSDAYPDQRWCEEIINSHERGILAGGGPILVAPNQKSSSLANAQYYLQFNEFTPFASRGPKAFCPSCNFFCDKALFEKVGGFPKIRASEDVLLGANIRQAGEVIFFEPRMRVYHIFREKLWAYLKNQILLGRHILLYRRKASKSFIYRSILPVLLLPAFVLIKGFRIEYRIFKSRDKVHIWKYLMSLPLFLLGLLYWSFGFVTGVWHKE